LVWFAAVASLPVLLILSAFSHSWLGPVWSISSGSAPGNTVPLSISLALRSGPADTSPALTGTGDEQGGAAFLANPGPAALRIPWPRAFFDVWGGGTVLALGAMLVSSFQLSRLLRRAKPVRSPAWLLLLEQLRKELPLRRAPRLFESAENVMPMTWGSWRPILLLPPAAVEWSMERRRVVLLHELAHVKRWDSLTQFLVRIICSLFWVHPLVWVAAARMRIERERACDDMVLRGGWKASEYAAQLLDIARGFQRAGWAPGIAMARPGQLHARIACIIDGKQARRSRPLFLAIIVGFFSVLAAGLAGTAGHTTLAPSERENLRRSQIFQLESFARAKERQSEALAKARGEAIAPDFKSYFDAAIAGDVQTVTNRYEYLKRHHPQYANGTNAVERLRTAYWSPVLELCLAYDQVANCEPKYTRILADGIIHSIPAGSIYFGGTDPGRGVPTAFEKSSIDGDPFFCLTQNALADGTYLEYLRAMYGPKIYIPTADDSQRCFQEYMADVTRRMQENRLKPGEQVHEVDHKLSVSGQVSVMAVNGLLAKVIFDENPDREFYIEESFPLDWMYPYLEPHGLILKLNRQPRARLSEQVCSSDRAYWSKLVADAAGSRVNAAQTVRELAAFTQQVYVRKDLSGFDGDPAFIQNDYAKRIFSKLRSSIAGIYAWRLGSDIPAEFKPASELDRQRLMAEADLAFRQAFALCPYSPEALFRYVNFLVQCQRREDACLLAEAALAVDPKNNQVRDLLAGLQGRKSQ
ncbi:MAG TPA: M56 family metallopeptidase, partial [Verrucomicrobiae bacterium]|nr:M56 family metallopeptidase [Verrucomicrobiae bacterium]